MVNTLKLAARRALLLFCLLLMAQAAESQQVLKRKNIDNLTKEEMAAYQHALQVLNDNSIKNPFDMEGYAWQAWVHNTSFVSIPTTWSPKEANESYSAYYQRILGQSKTGGTPGYPGECEHGKDLFLFWHRAEFYYVEKVLQHADPDGTITDSRGHKGPSTAKVTIPYWNFTKPASGVGKRFPKAFENKTSILYRNNRDTGVPQYVYTNKDYIQNIVNNNWTLFGGYVNGVGGGAAMRGGFGLFELKVHNFMHWQYCGGDMFDNSTAAYDPIFFSFHAYIDLVFDEWLRLNKMEATGMNGNDTITSLDYHLRGQNPAKYNLKDFDAGKGNRPTMGACALYLDHDKLGYEYEMKPEDRYQPRSVAIKKLLDKTGKPLVFGKSAMSTEAALTTGTELAAAGKVGIVTEEGPVAGNKMIGQDGNFNFETDVHTSFKLDVYIHPKNVKAAITDKAFRSKYLAGTVANWQLTHMDDMHTGANGKTRLNIYIAPELNDITKNDKPEDWVVTTNLTHN